MVAGEQCVLTGWTLPHRDVVTGKQKKLKITPEQWTEPSLAIREVTIEGPLTTSGELESYPPTSVKQMYGDLELRPVSETQPGFTRIPKRSRQPNATMPNGRPIVGAVFSRPECGCGKTGAPISSKSVPPACPEELQNQYVDRVRASLAAGTPFHAAMRSVFKTILCSPHVVFLDEQPGKLDGYALATRLAYSFGTVLPDDALLAHGGG